MAEVWDSYCFLRERNCGLTDVHGRKSFLLTEAFHTSLRVSEQIRESGFRPVYPEGKKFVVCLSHDIDTLFTPRRALLRGALSKLIRGRLPGAEVRAALDKTKSVHNNLGVVRAFLKEKGVLSSFFFLSLTDGDRDYNYEIGEIADEIRGLAADGHSIGLHGGHSASVDAECLRREFDRLHRVLPDVRIRAYRSHYLKHSLDFTWDCLENLGVEVDATMGFHDCVGYRNGICWPYRPYLMSEGRFSTLVCIPLTIMDGTLDVYMNLNVKDSFDFLATMIKKVSELGGVVTLLWHNTGFWGDKFELLDRLVEYCLLEGAWFPSMEQLHDYWLSREYDKQLAECIQKWM